ncbi:hypothetical protein LB504_007638 [Fusarium proliferatum]|nr:hypothetical protein LB504_007638 [Fusarium proliferatum]
MRSRQPDLWAAEYITFAAATIFLILRIVSRRITRIRFWWDDYFACASYATAVCWGTVLPICTIPLRHRQRRSLTSHKGFTMASDYTRRT